MNISNIQDMPVMCILHVAKNYFFGVKTFLFFMTF